MVQTFQSNHDEDGYVVFVIDGGKYEKAKTKQFRIIGFSNGVLKRISLDSLAVDQQWKLPLNSSEKLTCGHFSDNGFNFVVGTNQGTLFIARLYVTSRKRSEIKFCRIEDIGKSNSFDADFKS